MRTDLFDTLEPRILLSGDDHPDILDFPDATPLTTDVLFGGFSGDDGHGNYTVLTVGAEGDVETFGDTDVFSFTTPENANGGIVIGMQTVLGEFAPAVALLDEDGNTLAAEDGRGGIAFLTASDQGHDPDTLIALEPNTTYYVMVYGGIPEGTWETSSTGKYRAYVYMDITGEEFGGGGGGGNGGDQGDDGHGGDNGGDNGDHGDGGDEGDDGGDNGDNGGNDGGDDGGNGDEESHYSIVRDPGVPAELDDDHADIIEYRDAEQIKVDPLARSASIIGAIETNDDTDTFLYTPDADGPVSLEVVNADGGFLDGAVTVYTDAMIPLWEDSTGHAGATAELTFNATADATYVIAISAAGSTGAYDLRLSAAPDEYVLYHPEGYASKRIDEFIPLVNPNPTSVDYTIIARYEWGERDQIIASGTIAPHSRGGVTVTSSFDPDAALVRKGVPYALEIRSNGPLGATLSHYDFGITTGESFTSRVATEWTFAQATRGDGHQDFLVFSNPNDHQVDVTATLYYEDGSTATLVRTVDALRRSGFAFATDPDVPTDGVFGVRLTADAPIVAALTSFDTANSRGYGLLGDNTGGATRGVIPALMPDDAGAPTLAIVNTSSQATKVTLRAGYVNAPLADQLTTVTVAARSTLIVASADLDLQADEVFGISYAAAAPVTVTGFEFRAGDADATSAATAASRSSLIADAFVAPKGAGVNYFEWLHMHNPTGEQADVTLSLYFADGTTSAIDLSIGSGDYRSIRVDQLDLILERAKATPFSIGIESTAPLVSSFVHYDFYLDGGWSAQAAPTGMTSELTLF